jgi:hypothetical protein
MPRTTPTQTSPSPRRRRPRTAPAAGRGRLNALARDDAAARLLAHDLAALVRAGLVAPTGDGEDVRFAVVEPCDEAE